MNKFQSVLEEIDWLWNEWWVGQPDSLSEGHLRRGSTTLRLLLLEGSIQNAWRHYGFERQPRILGPDIVALSEQCGYRLDLAASVIAGGGRQNGIDVSFIGAFRIDHPVTNVAADSESGFAVCTTSIARLASDRPTRSPVDELIEKPWYLSEYLESTAAVRRGIFIKRREVIEYFRNFVGGAHNDSLKGSPHPKRERYELIAELEKHTRADIRDGLHFELLSIGQAVARAPDIRTLADHIRGDS